MQSSVMQKNYKFVLCSPQGHVACYTNSLWLLLPTLHNVSMFAS